MKLKPDHKVCFLIIGFASAWFALYIMLSEFYEGLVRVTVAAVEGGTYQATYLRGEEFLIWVISMAVSSLCLAIGLRAEELH